MKKTVLTILLFVVCSAILSAEVLSPYKAINIDQVGLGDEYTVMGEMLGRDAYINKGNNTSSYMLFNLKNKFRSVELNFGCTDKVSNNNNKYFFSFYVDGVLAKEVQVDVDGFPQSIQIDLNYKRQLVKCSWYMNEGDIFISGFDFK